MMNNFVIQLSTTRWRSENLKKLKEKIIWNYLTR